MPVVNKQLASRSATGVWEAYRADMAGLYDHKHGTVGSGENKTTVEQGTFVWVVPLHMTPDEARNKGPYALELKQVRAIFRDEEKDKFIFECQDYLRGPDVLGMEVDLDDPDTLTLVACLGGPDKYVWTVTRTFVWESRVEAVVDIAILDPWRATFPPLLPGQPFTREDIKLEIRKQGTELIRGACRAPRTICKANGECRFARRYTPHVHHVRWCEGCRTWYHRQCLEENDIGEEIWHHEDLDDLPTVKRVRWELADNARIVRKPRTDVLYHAVPFSHETILLEPRTERRRYGLNADAELPDFEAFVMDVMEAQGIAEADQAQLYDDLLEYTYTGRTQSEMVYHCGGDPCGELV